MIHLLQKTHPFIFNPYSILIPGAITTILIFLLKPFELAHLSAGSLFGFSVLFGALASMCVWLAGSSLRAMVKKEFLAEQWTVGKELALIMTVLSLITSSIFGLFLLLDTETPPALLFRVVFLRTLVISLFPVIILVLYEQYYHQRIKLQQAEELNRGLQAAGIQSSATESQVRLNGENGKLALQLPATSILHVKSAGNYIEVFYVQAGALRKELIRNRMKAVEDQLPKDQFFRCHKSHIVQVHQILKVQGNARNLELILQPFDLQVPVARGKSEVLLAMLQRPSQ